MLDDTRDQNLLIPTRHHVVPKSIGKRQTKEDTNGFSSCNNVTMTDSWASQYIHKPFIFITREVFVRHTVSCNFRMFDDTHDQNLLIPTRHHVVPKSIGKRQTKEDTNGFSGCNTWQWQILGPVVIYINHLYMLAPILAPAQCWNWHWFFAPCWNWDADIPILAPCHDGAHSAGTGYPIQELQI